MPNKNLKMLAGNFCLRTDNNQQNLKKSVVNKMANVSPLLLMLPLFFFPVAHTHADCRVVSGKNFSGQNLSNHNFSADPPGSLKGANFSNATLNGAIFANQDLSYANFQNAKLGPSDKGNADFTNTNLLFTCFIGATLNGTDFSFANISATDFSSTSLMQAEFGPSQNIIFNNDHRTLFVDSTIDVNAITTDNWKNVDFTNAKFQNLSPATFSLAGKDITDAKLGGTNFNNIDMTGANLTRVDFSYAQLFHANLTSTALNGAKLNHAKASYATFDCAEFYVKPAVDGRCGVQRTSSCASPPTSTAPNASADLTMAGLQNTSLLNTVLDSAILTGANLSGTTAINSSFQNASLEANGNGDVTGVQGSNLSYANFRNAHVNSVQFNNTVLTGACFDKKTTMNATSFYGAIMPEVTFDSAVLEGVSFNSAILEKAVFSNATLKTTPRGGSSVNFACAQLGGSNFSNAVILSANFDSAVMPPASACCQQQGGDAWCGTIDVNQTAYSGVNYPKLSSSVTCPNGEVDQCSGLQWTIPSWQTSVCNSNHTIQTVWIKPDCGGIPGDRVNFKDMNLKACILSSLPGKPSGISKSTASAMLTINCPGLGISDLTGLESFTHVNTLDLSDNQIKQFDLPLLQLQKLKLENNQLAYLDVSNYTHLIQLDVSNNRLKSITGLVSINPVVLDLSYNQLSSFDLPIFNTLVLADLSHNNLTSVLDDSNNDLSNLTAINYLDLSYNSISTIGDVSNINNLSTLFLACNPGFDCSSLKLTENSSALPTSHCAIYNKQDDNWILQPHPDCPTASGLSTGKAAALQGKRH